jgi:hypothetical protein
MNRLKLSFALSGLAMLVAVPLLVKPVAEWRLEQRLKDRFGAVRSLSIEGSPLALARGRAERLELELGTARLEGGAGDGVGAFARVAHVELRADALEARGARFEGVQVTKDDDRLRAEGALPSQSLTLGDRTVQVTPETHDGELVLVLEGGRRLRVFAQDGQLNVGLGGGGLLAGLARPVPVDGLYIDSLQADEGGRVDLRATVL